MDPFYQAELRCRRCDRLYMVPMMAEKFTYWICVRTQSYPAGRPCRTINVWK